MAREINDQDELRSTLVKLIPTEVIGFYTAAQAVVPQADGAKTPNSELNAIVLTAVAGLWFAQRVRKRAQLVVSTIAFVVWLYTLGGPFKAWETYDNVHLSFQGSGTLALLLFTFVTGIIPWTNKGDNQGAAGQNPPPANQANAQH